MDTAVDAREGYDPVAARNGRLSLGNTSLTEIANAPADAEWPEGNEVDDGISTQRLSGTPSSVQSGRLRSPISLMSWLQPTAVETDRDDPGHRGAAPASICGPLP